MKIYLASSFTLIPKVEAVCKALEDAGHTITVKWWLRKALWDKQKDMTDEEFYSNPDSFYAYKTDKAGVWSADALVLVADDEVRAYNGANIELGWADWRGIPYYSIGKLDHSALYVYVNRCHTIEELVSKLGKQ